MKVRAFTGIAAAALIAGGCTTSTSAPKPAVAAITPLRCTHFLPLAVGSVGTPGPITATISLGDNGTEQSTGTTSTVLAQSSPIAAARSAANDHVAQHMPRSGWYIQRQDGSDAIVASGKIVLLEERDSDGTWFVQSGWTCA